MLSYGDDTHELHDRIRFRSLRLRSHLPVVTVDALPVPSVRIPHAHPTFDQPSTHRPGVHAKTLPDPSQ